MPQLGIDNPDAPNSITRMYFTLNHWMLYYPNYADSVLSRRLILSGLDSGGRKDGWTQFFSRFVLDSWLIWWLRGFLANAAYYCFSLALPESGASYYCFRAPSRYLLLLRQRVSRRSWSGLFSAWRAEERFCEARLTRSTLCRILPVPHTETRLLTWSRPLTLPAKVQYTPNKVWLFKLSLEPGLPGSLHP